ncbi:MAG: aldehyde ferredoxin oxidoreductase family protein [Spirochaetales bacterium]|nr:aldehyde ferredoxin oxidoreductase family protein [Spirochaetales bacterium]
MSGSMNDRMLRIDCGGQSSSVWNVPQEVRDYVGGIGYGTKIVVDEVNPSVDPLSPENKIVLTVGPLTGTDAPMHPQACIVTKSPLSGTILNCYAGGFLGAEIKFCGIDGIILEGACDRWMYLIIEDDKVTFHGAGAIIGRSTEDAEKYLKEKHGRDLVTLSIGKAGENGVAMASVFSETRTFGRGGAGAALGSKNIKAIGFRGTKGVDVADRAAFRSLVQENMEGIKKSCAEEYNLVGMFSRFGTGAGMGLVQSRGGLATRNHSYGTFEDADKIDGFAYEKNFYTHGVACYGCPVHCGRVHKFTGRGGRELWARGPEYETMFSLGSDLMNGDPDVLAEANRLTELYGMDSLTTGVTMAWAIEMAEQGLLLTDPGLDLKFGDPNSILDLLVKIGECEGIGELLAKGPKRAAEEVGPQYVGSAMQVKNSGFAAWMPRRMKGVALAFATSNRGACHKRAPIGAEIIGQIDMDSYEGKAPLVKQIQDTVNAIFTLVSCRFHEFITPHDFYPRYIEAATGQRLSLEEFYLLGERIWNLEKLFNLQAGFSRKDDYLPERCYEPIMGEASEGAVLHREKYDVMLDEYYRVRGWNSEGVPSQETLDRLGIA